MAYGRCAANSMGEAVVEWRRVEHQHVEADGMVKCKRCNGQVPSHRRNAFIGRRCPAWCATSAEEGWPAPEQDWGAWIFAELGRQAAGTQRPAGSKATSTARKRGSTAEPAKRAGQQEMQALFAAKAWRPHVAAQGPQLVGCLHCGEVARSWRSLQVRPCGSWKVRLPPRLQALLLLDSVAQAGGPPQDYAAALAARRGELPRPPE